MKDATLLTGSTNIYLCHSPARYNRRCTLRLLELEALLPPAILKDVFRPTMLREWATDDAISNRTIYWFVTNHLKRHDRTWVHAGETVFGYSKYREWLKHWGRTLFDCFRRGSRIMVRIDGELVETTCAQLQFFSSCGTTATSTAAASASARSGTRSARGCQAEAQQERPQDAHPQRGSACGVRGGSRADALHPTLRLRDRALRAERDQRQRKAALEPSDAPVDDPAPGARGAAERAGVRDGRGPQRDAHESAAVQAGERRSSGGPRRDGARRAPSPPRAAAGPPARRSRMSAFSR